MRNTTNTTKRMTMMTMGIPTEMAIKILPSLRQTDHYLDSPITSGETPRGPGRTGGASAK
jgi:hypothetical protein